MSYFAAFEGIPGISTAVFGDTNGRLIEAKGGFTPESEGVAALCAVLFRQAASLSSTLRRGPCEMLVIRTEGSAGVLLFREGCVAHLEMEPKRLSAALETKLRVVNWLASRPGPSAPLASPAPSARIPPPTPPRGAVVQKPRVRENSLPVMPPATVPPGRSSDSEGGPPSSSSAPTEAAPSSEAPKRSNTGPVPSKTPEAVFAGDLGIITLPDVLEFCRNSQRTGTLICQTGEQEGTVLLRRGMISVAVSPKSNAASMLARLVEKGRLSEQQARSLSQGKETNADPSILARRLVDAGLMDGQAARELILEQIQSAIDELLNWVDDGRFAFHPSPYEPGGTDTETLADSQMILLRIFKDRDEKDRDEGAI